LFSTGTMLEARSQPVRWKSRHNDARFSGGRALARSGWVGARIFAAIALGAARLCHLLQHVPRPSLQGSSSFVEVQGAVVNACGTLSGGARDVVDDRLDHVWRNAQIFVHARHQGPPEIMNTPVRDAAARVEPAFRLRPPRKRCLAV